MITIICQQYEVYSTIITHHGVHKNASLWGCPDLKRNKNYPPNRPILQPKGKSKN